MITIICGPTCSSKSAKALELANQSDSVIINADSMQCYKDAPILTAQPTALELQQAEHKLYAFLRLDDDFSVAQWLKLAIKEINTALARNVRPIVVGGTGLYISALIDGLALIPDIPPAITEELRLQLKEFGPHYMHKKMLEIEPYKVWGQSIKPNDAKRILRATSVYLATKKPIYYWWDKSEPFYSKDMFTVYKLLPDRNMLYSRCNDRFDAMIERGAISEVKRAMSIYQHIKPKIIGFRQLQDYISGLIPLTDAITIAKQLTRNYAKRQYTWFNAK